MKLKQVFFTQGTLRFFADMEEAYSNDPDGLADILGYSLERTESRLEELRTAIRHGKDVNTVTCKTVLV